MKIERENEENVNSTENESTSDDCDSGEDEKCLEDSEEESESDSETESDTDSESNGTSANQNDDFDHHWEEQRKDAPVADKITRRIAVCNMDWDRIRAVDLLVCFDSFKPTGGHINSVKIYPSEFGLERMEKEKLKGPPELVEETLPNDGKEVEDTKGSKYHREKLRQYQMNRLKYFYAVVECDSPETANVIYEQLNGMEYESSSIRFDLRFIPDEMTFDQNPKSIAEKLPELGSYKPRLFVTSALQQVKVNLTWDETAPKRREFFQKIFTDPDSVENEISEFLASESSESEEETSTNDDELNKNLKTEDRIAKYRQLLSELEEKEKKKEEEKKSKYEVEITWDPGFKEKTEEKVKEKIKKDSLTPFEELLAKKKEDKKLKKKDQKAMQKQAENSSGSEDESDTKSEEKQKLAELLLISDSKKEASNKKDLKKKKKEAQSEELEGFVADMNDPRFSAMYSSSLFNMIPADQQVKKESNFSFKRPKDRKSKSKTDGGHKSFKKAKFH